MVGVVTQGLMINTLEDTTFWRKAIGVRLRSTNLSPRTSPGSNLGGSGGRSE